VDRIARNFPLTTFKRCQLCGYTSQYNDICEFRMVVECDENDDPEPGNMIVVCDNKNPACQKTIEDSARLYITIRWGSGAPGHLMLLCGDCQFRDGTSCKHADLKTNGGAGLEIQIARPLIAVHVCFTDGTGTSTDFSANTPAVECAGRQDKT
jgi:hypothetical protein